LHPTWCVSLTHSSSISACWFNIWNAVIWFESLWIKWGMPEKLWNKWSVYQFCNLSSSCQRGRPQNYNKDFLIYKYLSLCRSIFYLSWSLVTDWLWVGWSVFNSQEG
jgi:hypothetical protein